VHSSTITVAVLEEPSEVQVYVDPRDIDMQTCRSGGSGGQKVNKTESAVVLTHKPTGIVVRCETERSQFQNRTTAMALLRARIQQAARKAACGAQAADRRAQVGSGERGDKRRTVRMQDGTVTDHLSGRTWKYRDYERGVW
jgi:peptide chain release factor 1